MRISVRWIAGLACLLFLGAPPAYAGFGFNIFGYDDREPITSRDYPWKTIGQLSNGCTGTLIAPNLVLTAAHCSIVAGTNNLISGLSFRPSMVDWSYSHSTGVSSARFGGIMPASGGSTNYDWAILVLEHRLGDTYGWMGVDPSYSGSYVHLAGYSADYNGGGTGTVHRNCSIRNRAWGFWLHDCDTTRGSSGGPVFVMDGNKPMIVAVNVAENRGNGETSLRVHAGYDPSYTNYAVPASTFIDDVRRMKNE